jgi:transcriptional regulator with XRE-family HTH domain
VTRLITKSQKRAIRVFLAEKDQTQEWLARRLGVSSSALSRVLSGYAPLTDDLICGFHSVAGIDLAEPKTEVA